mmetsp:Transcript_46134/g.147330  ORF Transcript_46134/g.147330 Transcript_46134/m.147330 type:complete len:218 (-) Transcript_46134:136-789(-)
MFSLCSALLQTPAPSTMPHVTFVSRQDLPPQPWQEMPYIFRLRPQWTEEVMSEHWVTWCFSLKRTPVAGISCSRCAIKLCLAASISSSFIRSESTRPPFSSSSELKELKKFMGLVSFVKFVEFACAKASSSPVKLEFVELASDCMVSFKDSRKSCNGLASEAFAASGCCCAAPCLSIMDWPNMMVASSAPQSASVAIWTPPSSPSFRVQSVEPDRSC